MDRKDTSWVCIYTTHDFLRAEVMRTALENEGIKVAIMNKQDSSYHFGDIDIMVPEEEKQRALTILKNSFTI